MSAPIEPTNGLEQGELPALGILAELPSDIRGRLSSCGRLQMLQPGTFLTRQGTAHHGLSVILKGQLVVSCHAHGDYVELARLGPGHTVGEMSLLDHQNSSADVCVADEVAQVWSIDGSAFDQIVEADHMLGCAVFRMLARELGRRLRQNSDHMLQQADELRTHFRDIDY